MSMFPICTFIREGFVATFIVAQEENLSSWFRYWLLWFRLLKLLLQNFNISSNPRIHAHTMQ